MTPDQDREIAATVIEKLRQRLESKGLLWDRLPHVTDIDTPPACFVFKARGDAEEALKMWHSWLAAVAETDDVNYRYDQPRDHNFCIDCTSSFRGEARRAGMCQFRVVFETRQFLGEREMIGVSRSPEVAPSTYEIFDDMVVPREALPISVQERLRELEARKTS
jgi:hypothetical protein